MTAPFGVTADGFSRPSVQELLALVEADQRAEISQTLDLSADSVLGQVNGIICRQLGVAWEAVEAVHDGNDPDRAEDDAATSLAKITGTNRAGASKSEVPVQVTLAIGTLLQAGVHFAHVTGKPDIRFTPAEDFTAPGPSDPGTYTITFESELTGPVQAPAGTLNVIATPVVGWSGANNPLNDAVLGRTADDDADLRVRREQGLALAGSSGVDQIRADVLAVEDVTSCQVFENWTDTTDAEGLPPKSFQVVLWDDAGADDDAIAQAIWISKPGGIQSFGAESGTALDKKGNPQVMRFSRATAKLIWIEFDLSPGDGYVGDAAFKLAVATSLDAVFGTGADVGFSPIVLATQGLGAEVLAVRFGLSASPATANRISISNTEISRYDTSRILITGA